MEYFVLQDQTQRKLPNEANGEKHTYYNIPGLKNNLGGKIGASGMTAPTQNSIKTGILEWIVPNNQFNQNWISQHYSHLKILHAGEEQQFVGVTKMDNLPVPMDTKKDSAFGDLTAEPIKNKPIPYNEQQDVGHNLAARGGTDLSQVSSNAELEAAEDKVKQIQKSISEKQVSEKEKSNSPVRETVEPTLVPNVFNEPIIAPLGGLPGADTPTPVEGPGGVIDESSTPTTKLSPQKINSLKVEISKKLTELGVDVPKNSSLPELESLLNQEIAQAQ